MNTRYGRHVMQDLADLSGQEVPGLRIERLASHYEGAIAERKARERANERELRLNIPHIHQVQQRIAEALEEEAGEIHAKLPIASVYDALRLVKARKDLDRDAGLRALHGHLESMWRKNRTSSITASSYLKLREHYARNFPRSAVADVIAEIGQRGYATLPRTDLHHIASQIETQDDYDRLMVKYGLSGPHPHQVKARQYILAILNDEEVDLPFEEDWDEDGEEPWEGREKERQRRRRRRERPREKGTVGAAQVDDDERHQAQQEGIFSTYEEAWAIAGPRLEQVAKETVDDLREASDVGGERLAVSDPWLMEGDGYSYEVNINYGDLEDEEDSIDISFRLADSGAYEGIHEDEEGWGVNVMVDIVHYGGEILGGFTPYNYTSEVWTNEVGELKRRLTMIDSMSLADFIREDAVPSRLGRHGRQQAQVEGGFDPSILDMIARTLFVSEWADVMEERGESFSGVELMDVAPETPPEFEEIAKRLYRDIEQQNNINLEEFIPPGETEDFDREDFGYCLAMEALGHGVSWADDHEDHGLNIPDIGTSGEAFMAAEEYVEREHGAAPHEEDAFIEDARGGGYDVSAESKHLGHVVEWDEAVELLKEWMDDNQYWPNVWHVNDHGNVSLVEDFGA